MAEPDDRDPGDVRLRLVAVAWSAELVAAGKVSRSGLQADGGAVYWCESRPDGRRPPGGGAGRAGAERQSSLTGRGQRSEPGARVRRGAATVRGGVLFYVDQADQQWYRVARSGAAGPTAGRAA